MNKRQQLAALHEVLRSQALHVLCGTLSRARGASITFMMELCVAPGQAELTFQPEHTAVMNMGRMPHHDDATQLRMNMLEGLAVSLEAAAKRYRAQLEELKATVTSEQN